MLFDTPVYLFFLTAMVILYWCLPGRRQQNILLLIASYFFYGWWDWRFLSLILISTVVDFFCARYVARSESPARRKALLALSVTINLGFLSTFKYFDFFTESFVGLLQTLGFHPGQVALLRVVLPPGISFYTFQELAYIVDVYFRKLEPADSLIDYALFITLFPHLIAGPIQRPSHLLPQVQKPRTFDPQRFFDGILLIVSGLFRKCVVADNCALLADAAFSGRLGPHSLASVAIGVYAFAWQIYGDFSGYSDIARGSAQLLGFHFMVNFRQPYLAASLQDFWRRWHISLSTWLRDYLYIPLGGSRHGEAKTYRNLLATMLLGGLWHGANWTFVVWGFLHGLGLAGERAARTWRKREEPERAPGLLDPRAWIARIVLFHVVCLSWIFFRAPSFPAAFAMLKGLTVLSARPEMAIALKFLALFTIPLFLLDLWVEYHAEEYVFQRKPANFRMASALGLLLAITLFAGNQINAFIYFQF